MTNGYFEVYKEVKKRNSSLSDNQCHERASEIWKNLPEEEKNRYKSMAKRQRGDGKKYNSQGIDIDLIERRQQEIEAEKEAEVAAIQQMIEEAIRRGEIADTVFYLLATNYHCVVLTTQEYITCEVALVPFSLSKGVMEPYHTLINVGLLPAGYSGEASNLQKIHSIPPPPIPEGESDLLKVLANLLTKRGDKPVFCYQSQESQVKSFINRLRSEVGKNSPHNIRVYSLSTLFFKLRNALTEEPGLPQISLVNMELEKDPFMYTQGIECLYHKNTDQYFNCALSLCRRWAYTICDHCCKHLGIELVSGQHIPKKSIDIDYYVEPAPVKRTPNVPQATYHYEPPKEAEQIIKEEKWPSLGGPSSGLSASQGAIPRRPQPGGAWGSNKNINPPAEVVSAKSPDADNEWPSPAPSSSKKRGGRRH